MRIIRSAPGRFVIVPQDSARDELLSLSAAGLLAYLLTHADGYPVTANEVERRRPKDSRRTVRAAMRELEGAGYLRRERVPLEGGRWSTELVLSDTPTRNTEGGGTNTPTEVPVSGTSERRHPGSPAPRSAESSAGGVSIRKTTEKNQGEVPERTTTSDDDPARAREGDPNVENSNHRAEPAPPNPFGPSAVEDNPPGPHLSMPSAGTSVTRSPAGTEGDEGSPVLSSACGPWALTAASLVDGEVVGNGVELDSAACDQLVTAVAERLAAGVEPGVLAEELGGEFPPGVDAVRVLPDCVRQTRPADDVHQVDAVEGCADGDGTPGAQMTYDGRVSSPAHGGQAAARADLVQALIDAVHEVTGQTIDRDLAGKGVAMVLRAKDGTPRAVSDPVAYLRTAVEAAPTRFLPVLVPPRLDGRRESKAARRARGFEELRTWAAETTDGGQRLDNTGVTVVDQDGQTAEPVPAEPPNDPWAAGTTPSGWMASPVRQRGPEPHVCRYGCRPGPHTYEDPETGIPTRCPIHHDHARHREAA